MATTQKFLDYEGLKKVVVGLQSYAVDKVSGLGSATTEALATKQPLLVWDETSDGANDNTIKTVQGQSLAGPGDITLTGDDIKVSYNGASGATEDTIANALSYVTSYLASAVDSTKTTLSEVATSTSDGLMSSEDKAKLDDVESGAQVNVIETVKVDGTALVITDKAVNIDLSGKVDKIDGKALSTNDFTDELKTKLEGIADGANKITKLSELTNDVTYLTTTEIETKLNAYQLKLVSGENIKTINGESVLGTGDITIDLSLYKVVSELPASDADPNKIYMVAYSGTGAPDTNKYIEYIYRYDEASTSYSWEEIGEYNAAIDLTPYVLKTDLDSTLTAYELKADAATSYSNLDKDIQATKASVTTSYETLYAYAEAEVARATKAEKANADAITTINTKLDDVEDGAEVNQNAFSNVKVGETTIAATSKTDTVTFASGTDGLSIAASDKTVTFSIEATKLANDAKLTFAVGDGATASQVFSANASEDGAISIPTASSTAYGVIKVGYTETGNSYAVKVDASGKAFVDIPWTDTTVEDVTVTGSGNAVTTGSISADGKTLTLSKGTTFATQAEVQTIDVTDTVADGETIATFTDSEGNTTAIKNNMVAITDDEITALLG